ncbi:RPA-interacting protein B [Heracleum sosnowskyi]|uniref:RPA-interacting protein B n=1 Tax=Heracleum sosnowskyi TaxID=360622 RepID=A0AAD8LZ89_9APIA|nr:RPA-interacting protein B [Heracleum sosnowskyi]
MGGVGGDDDVSRAAPPRESLKTKNNYSNWKHKLRENCFRRIRDDRTRLLWKMRNNNININHSSSSHQEESTFLQSALQDIVSDELTKINNNRDLLWEYDGLHSQPECEDILLEMQNIFYQDLQTTQQTSWEDDEDHYLARAVYHHMQLNDRPVQETVWCPICKQGELQENYSHVYCTACELRLLRGEEVTLELIRSRLAEAHAEHLDRGCKLTPKILMESRFDLSVLYIECTGCDTFEVVI